MINIVFDLETTGLNITTDIPIQICAIAYDNNYRELDVLEFYIKPHDEGFQLPEIITRITGITTDILVHQGIPTISAVTRWQHFLRKHYPVHLYGYNCLSFDYPMIMNWVNKYCGDRFKFPPIHEVTDIMHKASSALQTTRWLKLSDCATKLGVPYDAAKLHEAKADVRLTTGVWRKVQELTGHAN